MVSRDKLAEALQKLEEIEALVASLNIAGNQLKPQIKKVPVNQ